MLNIKHTKIYKLVKFGYKSYIDYVCDTRRRPLINSLKGKLLDLNFRGGVSSTISMVCQ